MEYVVCVYKNGNEGEYVAIIPDIDMCAAYGDSLEDLYEAIEDTVELTLEGEDLPLSNPMEYFSDDILRECSIPLECVKKVLKVQEEGVQSYEVVLQV